MIEISPDLWRRAERLLSTCRARGLTLATAESRTGGLIAGVLTALPGSSAVLDRGFVTYSNRAKAELLGVPAELSKRFGAVSEPVARAMAAGCLERAGVGLAVAVTGIAGPDGGSPAKPVGLVHLAACAASGGILHRRMVFAGDRQAVRAATVADALALLGELID